MDGPVPNHTPYSLCRPHTSQPQSTSSMDISVWKFLKTACLVHYVSDNWRNAIHCGISLVRMPRKAHTTHWKPWEHLEVCQMSMTPSSGTVEWAMKSGFGYLFVFFNNWVLFSPKRFSHVNIIPKIFIKVSDMKFIRVWFVKWLTVTDRYRLKILGVCSPET